MLLRMRKILHSRSVSTKIHVFQQSDSRLHWKLHIYKMICATLTLLNPHLFLPIAKLAFLNLFLSLGLLIILTRSFVSFFAIVSCSLSCCQWSRASSLLPSRLGSRSLQLFALNVLLFPFLVAF